METLEMYDCVCTLQNAEKYCKTTEGTVCCFFCRHKDHDCKNACKNDPTVCGYASGGDDDGK